MFSDLLCLCSWDDIPPSHSVYLWREHTKSGPQLSSALTPALLIYIMSWPWFPVRELLATTYAEAYGKEEV